MNDQQYCFFRWLSSRIVVEWMNWLWCLQGELEQGQGGLRRQFLSQTENGLEAATSCALEGLGLNCKIVGSVDNKTVVSHPIDVKGRTLHEVQGPVTIRNLATTGSSTVYSGENLGCSPFLVHETGKRNRLLISHLPDSGERIRFGSTLSNPCVIQQCLVDQKWRGARQICLLPHAHLSSGASSITRVQSRLYAGNPASSSIQSQSSSREHLTDSAVPNSLIEVKALFIGPVFWYKTCRITCLARKLLQCVWAVDCEGY